MSGFIPMYRQAGGKNYEKNEKIDNTLSYTLKILPKTVIFLPLLPPLLLLLPKKTKKKAGGCGGVDGIRNFGVGERVVVSSIVLGTLGIRRSVRTGCRISFVNNL